MEKLKDSMKRCSVAVHAKAYAWKTIKLLDYKQIECFDYFMISSDIQERFWCSVSNTENFLKGSTTLKQLKRFYKQRKINFIAAIHYSTISYHTNGCFVGKTAVKILSVEWAFLSQLRIIIICAFLLQIVNFVYSMKW